MKKIFDLYSELLNLGFTYQGKNEFGRDCLTIELEKEVEVAWYGKQKSTFKIEVAFNPEHSNLIAFYYNGGHGTFKAKDHLNDKRALNAIRATAKNHGFKI